MVAVNLEFANFANSTLAGNIGTSATVVNLQAGTGALFPNPVAPLYFIGVFTDAATRTLREIVWCTARSADSLTIVRAQEGTTALAWNANDIFSCIITAGTLKTFADAIGSAFPIKYGSVSVSTSIDNSFDGFFTNVVGTGTTQTLIAPGTAVNMSVGFYAVESCTIAIAGGSGFEGGSLTGLTSITLLQHEWLCLESDGVHWRIFSASPDLLGFATVASVAAEAAARIAADNAEAALRVAFDTLFAASGPGSGTLILKIPMTSDFYSGVQEIVVQFSNVGIPVTAGVVSTTLVTLPVAFAVSSLIARAGLDGTAPQVGIAVSATPFSASQISISAISPTGGTVGCNYMAVGY